MIFVRIRSKIEKNTPKYTERQKLISLKTAMKQQIRGDLNVSAGMAETPVVAGEQAKPRGRRLVASDKEACQPWMIAPRSEVVAADEEANRLEVISVNAEAGRGGRGGQGYCAVEGGRRGGRPADQR